MATAHDNAGVRVGEATTVHERLMTMATALQITVNGRRHRVEGAPETPLRYVLGNELRLGGPKFA